MEIAPIFIGIDVSKARLDVAMRPSAEKLSVSNDEAGIQALVKRLSELKPVLIVQVQGPELVEAHGKIDFIRRIEPCQDCVRGFDEAAHALRI